MEPIPSTSSGKPPDLLRTLEEGIDIYDVEEGIGYVLDAEKAMEDGRVAANQRALSVPPSNPIQRPQLQNTSTTHREWPIFQPRCDNDKERNTSLKGCTRGNSLSRSWGSGQRQPKHEALEMSGSRPGEEEHHEQNSTQKVVEDFTRDRSSSPYETSKTKRSAELYDNEGELEEVIRVVKSNSGLKRTKHNSEFDPILISEGEPTATASGDAREQKVSHGKPDAPATYTEWAPYDRYKKRIVPSLPDFGGPQDQIAAVRTMPPGHKSTFLNGGHRPVNRLGSDGESSVFKAQRPPKAFDLTSDTARRRKSDAEVPARKRQRVGEPVIENGLSNQNFVDLVDSPEATSSQISGQMTRTSRQGYSQDGSRKGNSQHLERGVSEFKKVQSQAFLRSTRHSRKQNSQQNGNVPDARSTGSKTSTTSNSSSQSKDITIRRPSQTQDAFEDPMDLISDGEITSPRKAPGANFAVVVPISNKGTASSQPGRPKAIGSPKQKMKETEEESSFFPHDHGHPRRKGSTASQRSLEVSTSQNPAYKYQNKDRKNLKDQDIAHDLLKQVSETSTVEATRALDNATANRTSRSGRDGSLKQDERGRNYGVEIYDVLQIFSENCDLLSYGPNPTRYLFEDLETGRLCFLDDKMQRIENLGFSSKSINKITWSPESAKLQITKNRDPLGTKICLELQSPELSISLCKSLTASALSIHEMPKEHLEKIFQRNMVEIKNARKRTQSSNELEAADLEFLTSQKQSRDSESETRRQRARESGHGKRQPDEYEEDELSVEPNKTVRGAMRTRSPDLMEAPERATKSRTIAPNNFYSNRPSPPLSMEPLHGTRSSTRVTTRESTLRALPRQRTPSPERWTERNPEWRQKWTTSIIYPREGRKNRAIVDLQDIERLDEGEFLNDNLIVFYLRWLQHHLEIDRPDLAKRIYFHNTFFYTTLTKGVKAKGRINYEAVKRWTSKIDIISYDYIIVPVNEQAHWYVVIICNAPKLNPANHPAKAVPPEEKGIAPQAQRYSGVTNSPIQNALRLEHSPPAEDIDVALVPENTLKEPIGNNHKNERGSDDDTHAKDLMTAFPGLKDKDTVLHDSDIEMTDVPPIARSPREQKHSQELKPSPAKQGKRKSTGPPPRKMDPTDPRIIVLDSLGTSRSNACTTLREYIIQEFKSRGIDISSPGAIGMNAKILPLQDNYYDCGVFLLEYIEKFIQCPDDFIKGILRKEFDYKIQWRPQSEMRNHIRGILFDLQKEQTAEAEKLRKEKKSKRKPAIKDLPPAMKTIEAHREEHSLALPTLPKSPEKMTDGSDDSTRKAKRVPVVEIPAFTRNTGNKKISTGEESAKIDDPHKDATVKEIRPRSFKDIIFKKSGHQNDVQGRVESSQLGSTQSTAAEGPEFQPRQVHSDHRSAPSATDSIAHPQSQHSRSPSRGQSTKAFGTFDASIHLSIEDDEMTQQSHSQASHQTLMLTDAVQRNGSVREGNFTKSESPQILAPTRKRKATPFPMQGLSRRSSVDASVELCESVATSPQSETALRIESGMDNSVEFLKEQPRRTEVPSSNKDEDEDEMLLDIEHRSRRDSAEPATYYAPVRRLASSSPDTQKDDSPGPAFPHLQSQESVEEISSMPLPAGPSQRAPMRVSSPVLETAKEIPSSVPSTPQRERPSAVNESHSVQTSSRSPRQSMVKGSSPSRARNLDTGFRDSADAAIVGKHGRLKW